MIAAAKSISTVSPPPGVSVAEIVPPIASTNPRATERPRPTPVLLSWSPSRWNGANSCVLGAARDARTLVDDSDQHPVADLARGHPYRAVRGVPQRVVDEVGQHPLQ